MRGRRSDSKTRVEGYFEKMCGLDLPDVKEWLFCPGMLFQSTGKWWGDKGSRNRPHEGLDLLLYRDQMGRVLHIDETTRIPAISDGVVVGIIHDFLGKSVVVEHLAPDNDKERRYTIYAHTRPQNGFYAGTSVRRGDVIATVALPGRSAFPMAPHLHLSVAWAPQPISCDRLNWDDIAAGEVLTLLDPLPVIGCHYRVLDDRDPACRGL